MPILLCLCFSLVILTPSLVHAATLGNPGDGSFYSGIGVVSGWKCTANGPLTVRFNGGAPISLAYGNERPDVRDAGACPSADVGFVSIMNYGNLGDGTHTAVVYDNGVEFGRSTFTVATTGEPFVRGAEGECRVVDFPAPGESAQFVWNQSTQHLEMIGKAVVSGGDDHGNTAREATPVAVTSSTGGRIEPASDEDWFRLQVSSTGFLRLYPAGGGTWVELYQGEAVRGIVSWSENPNAAVRLHYNGRDNRGNYFAHYRVVPDVYYAVIREAGGGWTGPYQFDTRWTSNFQRGQDRHNPPARTSMMTAAATTEQGVLENPGNGSFYSGLGVVSGWKCTANGPLTVRFNGGAPIPLAYGNERPDVRDAGACPSAHVGFVSIMNWAELGDGTHTAVVYDNGVEFARSTFTVATTGEPFVRGAQGECRIADFPAPEESASFAWNQSTQHLELVNHRGGGGGPLGRPWSEATIVRLSSDTRGTLRSDTQGTLERADDVNYYRLDIPDAGTVTVDTTGNTDTIGQLRTGPTGTGSDGREVGGDDGAGSGNNFRISQPLPAGTYYILVSGRTTGTYTLRVRFTPDPACASDNVGDTPDSAAILVLDQTVRESLECEGDNDYFRVRVPRVGILDVKTWGHELGLDTEYDDLVCHDGHLCLAAWAPPENDGNHATDEVQAGTYYIRINDDSPIPYIGSYQLNVRLHPLQDDHGDWDVEATHVSVPSVTQGIIETLDRHDTQHGNYPTDVDVFEITLPEKPPESYSDFTWERQIIITVEGETLLQARLIDVSGSVFEQTRESQSDAPIQFTHTQSGGVNTEDKLWLEVAGADRTVHNTGPYTVRISQEEVDTGAPGIPRNVRVTEVGEDFIVVEWDPPTGGAASYNVYYRVAGGPESVFEGVATAGLRVTDIGDTEERCYQVTAVGVDGGESERTAEVCGSVQQEGDSGPPGGVEQAYCLMRKETYGCTGELWSVRHFCTIWDEAAGRQDPDHRGRAACVPWEIKDDCSVYGPVNEIATVLNWYPYTEAGRTECEDQAFFRPY